jgi:hypothetical protein
LLAVFVSCNQIRPSGPAIFSNVRRVEIGFSTSSLPLGIARIAPPGTLPYDVVTPVPHETIFKAGLAREAVIGRLKRLSNIEGDDTRALDPEDFIPSPVFTEFLHRTIAKHAPELVDYQNQAKKQREGWVYVIDGRTGGSNDPIPSRDVLGGFAVEAGVIMPSSYRPNGNYVLFTRDGFPKLHRILMGKLMEELLALNATESAEH